MKHILILVILVFASLSINGQILSANLQASGLTCSMCSNSIFKALKKVEFVDAVESDVENSTFKLVFKKEIDIDFDEIANAVVGAGFSIAKFTFIFSATDLKIQDKALIDIGGKSFYFINVKDETVNGETELKLLDKQFISPKQYNKVKKKLYSDPSKRVFNVSI